MKGFLIFRFLGVWSVVAQVTPLTNADFSLLREAVAKGGAYSIPANTHVLFTETLVVTNEIELHATGPNVILDGAGSVRLFEVKESGNLTLDGLILTNGYHQGAVANWTNRPPQLAGDGEGAAVSNAGHLSARNCLFTGNLVQGAPNTVFFDPSIGWRRESVGFGKGGAIYSIGFLTLDACTFTQNTAVGGDWGTWGGPGVYPATGEAHGGAVYINAGRAFIISCDFFTNLAGASPRLNGAPFTGSAFGGVLAVNGGTVVVTNSNFQANRAVGPYGKINGGKGNGGAIAALGGITEIFSSALTGNIARGGPDYHDIQTRVPGQPGRGGGLYIGESAEVMLRQTSMTENAAEGASSEYRDPLAHWDGSYDPFAFWQGPMFSVTDGSGGGIWNAGNLLLENVTLGRNSARAGDATAENWQTGCGEGNCYFGPRLRGSAHGGGIYTAGTNSVTHISFSTIAFNRLERGDDPTDNGTASGGGIYREEGEITIENSIIANNAVENVAGPLTDSGHNLITDGSLLQNDSTTPITLNAGLGPLGRYGSRLDVFPLLSNSPAIDAALCSSTPINDQRGFSRPAGRACDIGAFEAQTGVHFIVAQVPNPAPEAATLFAGDLSSPVSSDGYSILGPFAGGTYELRADGTTYLARPLKIVIPVDAPEIAVVDLPLHEKLKLTFTSDALVFAANANESWQLLESTDLVTWSEKQSFQTDQDGLAQVPLKNSGAHAFWKALRRDTN